MKESRISFKWIYLSRQLDIIKLQYTTRMLAREYKGQKIGNWNNDVFAKIEAQRSRITSRDLQYIRRFSAWFWLQVVQYSDKFSKLPTNPPASWLGEN